LVGAQTSVEHPSPLFTCLLEPPQLQQQSKTKLFLISQFPQNMSEVKQILSPDKEIKILKWIIHKGSQISNGSVLCLYQSPEGSDKVERLKNTACGLVKKLLHKEGSVVAKW
jgi:hypothetical protein